MDKLQIALWGWNYAMSRYLLAEPGSDEELEYGIWVTFLQQFINKYLVNQSN